MEFRRPGPECVFERNHHAFAMIWTSVKAWSNYDTEVAGQAKKKRYIGDHEATAMGRLTAETWSGQVKTMDRGRGPNLSPLCRSNTQRFLIDIYVAFVCHVVGAIYLAQLCTRTSRCSKAQYTLTCTTPIQSSPPPPGIIPTWCTVHYTA